MLGKFLASSGTAILVDRANNKPLPSDGPELLFKVPRCSPSPLTLLGKQTDLKWAVDQRSKQTQQCKCFLSMTLICPKDIFSHGI